MRMYFFNVTVRVEQGGRVVEAVLRKGARASAEHGARRVVLDHYLSAGFQVVKIHRIAETAA
jgi:hypothetical protein